MPSRDASVCCARAARRALLAAVVLVGLAASPAASEPGCGNGDWSDETLGAQGGDSGLGGTRVQGDDSGIGGTGIAGDDSGIGGTGVFGVITALGSLCVNGAWIQVPGDVEVVFENGIAIGAESLAVGQTVWLVARDGERGLETDRVWVMPRGADARDTAVWLDARIRRSSDLARLSLEGPVDAWGDRGFAVQGVPVRARDAGGLRGSLDAAGRVRVVGPLGRDGAVRAERIQVPTRPLRRPERPLVRPPRIDRPPDVERPVRPDTVIRPNETDRHTNP